MTGGSRRLFRPLAKDQRRHQDTHHRDPHHGQQRAAADRRDGSPAEHDRALDRRAGADLDARAEHPDGIGDAVLAVHEEMLADGVDDIVLRG